MAKRESTKPRLDAAAWIAAALEALAREGIAGLRVEPLAKRLGVTKGSFYWHFKDREALLAAAMDAWAAGRIAAIRAQAGDPKRRTLSAMADLYLRDPNPKGLAVELAIRALARADARAAKAVEIVDAERLVQVAALLGEQGYDAAEAKARALLFYGFLFGQSLMRGRDLAAARESAIALVSR